MARRFAGRQAELGLVHLGRLADRLQPRLELGLVRHGCFIGQLELGVCRVARRVCRLRAF